MPPISFDWNDENIRHVAKHDVTPEEAEQVLLGDPLEINFDADRNGEERWTYLGETARGRILMVIMTLRDKKMRVVTAFDAGSRDKRIYLETKAGWNDGYENS